MKKLIQFANGQENIKSNITIKIHTGSKKRRSFVGGYFIIQTPHPIISCGQSIYKDGWREGTWKGFDRTFTDPAPWYFRTIESWIELFVKNRLQIVQLKEPIFRSTGEIASLIIVGRVVS